MKQTCLQVKQNFRSDFGSVAGQRKEERKMSYGGEVGIEKEESTLNKAVNKRKQEAERKKECGKSLMGRLLL